MGEMVDRPGEGQSFGFDIRREGRRWTAEEIERKWREHETVPEKLELIEGKIFWSDEQRITMLGWMLEQLGADAAVRLGEPEVWREAVEEMLRERDAGSITLTDEIHSVVEDQDRRSDEERRS